MLHARAGLERLSLRAANYDLESSAEFRLTHFRVSV